MRSQDEIDEQINRAVELTEDGHQPNRWPGMTYEQGVDTALRWVTGESDDEPIGDD